MDTKNIAEDVYYFSNKKRTMYNIFKNIKNIKIALPTGSVVE